VQIIFGEPDPSFTVLIKLLSTMRRSFSSSLNQNSGITFRFQRQHSETVSLHGFLIYFRLYVLQVLT